jgi:hypothetical protein
MANKEILEQVFEAELNFEEIPDEEMRGLITKTTEGLEAVSRIFEKTIDEPTEETTEETIEETTEGITDKAKIKLTGLVSQRPSMGPWLMLDSVTMLADIFHPLRQPFFPVKDYLNLDFEVIHIESDHSTQLVKGNVCSSLTSKKIPDCLLTTLSRS